MRRSVAVRCPFSYMTMHEVLPRCIPRIANALLAGEWLGKAGYTGVQVSPPHEDITVKDYPDSDARQEPW